MGGLVGIGGVGARLARIRSSGGDECRRAAGRSTPSSAVVDQLIGDAAQLVEQRARAVGEIDAARRGDRRDRGGARPGRLPPAGRSSGTAVIGSTSSSSASAPWLSAFVRGDSVTSVRHCAPGRRRSPARARRSGGASARDTSLIRKPRLSVIAAHIVSMLMMCKCCPLAHLCMRRYVTCIEEAPMAGEMTGGCQCGRVRYRARDRQRRCLSVPLPDVPARDRRRVDRVQERAARGRDLGRREPDRYRIVADRAARLLPRVRHAARPSSSRRRRTIDLTVGSFDDPCRFQPDQPFRRGELARGVARHARPADVIAPTTMPALVAALDGQPLATLPD